MITAKRDTRSSIYLFPLSRRLGKYSGEGEGGKGRENFALATTIEGTRDDARRETRL